SAEDLYWSPATRFVGEFIGRLNILEDPALRAGLESGEVLAIRPEHVALAEAGAHEGTVRRVAFLGNTMRLGVGAGDQEIEIEVHGRRRRLAVGDTIRFDLPADRICRLAAAPA